MSTPDSSISIEKFVEKVAFALADVPSMKMRAKIDALIQYRSELPEKERKLVVGALRALSKRVDKLVDKLKGATAPATTE